MYILLFFELGVGFKVGQGILFSVSQVQYKCQIAYLNCMMVKDVFSVFRRLYTELSGRSAVGRTTIKDMEKLVTTSKHNM